MKYMIIAIVGSIIIGYLLGCINISYIISKIKGFDIRRVGSGNAGASNVVIVLGKRAGLFVALFDIFKAFVAVRLAMICFENAVAYNVNYAGILAGVFSMIGHIAPFYMGFKGGKGLATLGGTILGLDAKLLLILLVVAIVIAVVTDYICFVPVSMVVIFPSVYGYLHQSFLPLIIFCIVIPIVWYRHIENFRRIKEHKELRFHFLWNRGSESDRLGIPDDGKAIFEVDIHEERNANSEIKS